MAFATKPRQGMAMLEGARCGAGCRMPGWPRTWITQGPRRAGWLHEQKIPYVLAVPVSLPVAGPPGKAYLPKVTAAGDLLHYAISRKKWERRSCGEGSKGSACTTGPGSRPPCPDRSGPTASRTDC